MTLVALWQRANGDTTELVVAADSRLSGAVIYESGPKLFMPSRGDCVLAFAGDTYLAYPLILQVLRWADDYRRAQTRAMDLCDFAGHCARLCSGLLVDLVARSSPIPEGIDITEDFTIVLAGFSWRTGRYKIWESSVEENGNFAWITRRCSPGQVVFVGSGKVDAENKFRRWRIEHSKRRRDGSTPAVDWEPFDILRDMIRGKRDRTVGGAPQLVKVYRHMNVMSYAVPWKDGRRKVLTLLGRPLLQYERTQRLAFDPDSHASLRLWDYLRRPAEFDNSTA